MMPGTLTGERSPALDLGLAPVVVAVARGGSDAAVRFGAEEAHRTGRPLDLVHVALPGDGWNRLLGRDSLQVAAERARTFAGDSVVIETELLRGDALLELPRAARACALLVMERRHPADRRRPEASTTIAVADALNAPSVVVPAGWQEGHRRVVTVGLDAGAADHRAVRSALAQARLRGAALRVLVAESPTGPDAVRALRDRVDELLSRLGGDACDLSVELLAEPAGPALLHAAATSDLVVIGRHQPTIQSGSRLGPVAREVVREAACPVLLTRPAHAHAPSPAQPRRKELSCTRDQETAS